MEQKKEKYSAPNVHSVADMPTVVADMLKKGRDIVHALEFTTLEEIRKATAISELIPVNRTVLLKLLGESRIIKTPGEIAVMKKVCGIASQAHMECMKRVRAGMVENDLDALYHFFTKKLGGVNCLFQQFYPISAFSTSSATLHHWTVFLDADVVAKDGDLAMLDAGVEYACYGSDITRTFPISGKFSDRQKAVYNIVLAAHDAAFAGYRPGNSYIDVAKQVQRIIGEGLITLGLIQNVKDAAEAVEKRLVRLFYPHGLGHQLGLDGHDVIDVGWYGLPMREGMVITDEPGIYFHADTLLPALEKPEFAPYLNADVVRSYFDFGGIRIEDDVLITATGPEYISNLPRTVEDIEALLAEGRAKLGENWSV